MNDSATKLRRQLCQSWRPERGARQEYWRQHVRLPWHFCCWMFAYGRVCLKILSGRRAGFFVRAMDENFMALLVRFCASVFAQGRLFGLLMPSMG